MKTFKSTKSYAELDSILAQIYPGIKITESLGNSTNYVYDIDTIWLPKNECNSKYEGDLITVLFQGDTYFCRICIEKLSRDIFV